MQSGAKLTKQLAREHGIRSLGQRVRSLRIQGFDISTQIVWEDGKRFAEYTMAKTDKKQRPMGAPKGTKRAKSSESPKCPQEQEPQSQAAS